MLSVAEAQSLVVAEARAKPAVRLTLGESLGLVLAEPVASDVDSPPHDKSTVDGYALRSSDLAAGIGELTVIEEVMAGCVPQESMAAGEAARVMTGAPIPHGADAMVMHEKTALVAASGQQRVRVLEAGVRPGQNILPRGASLGRGDVVLEPGCELRPIEIGVLAEVGRTTANVIPRPVVAVLATGNELVGAGQLPGPAQIRDSNGPLLLAAVQRARAMPIGLGIARDDPAELERLISAGLSADILIVSGGVSSGALDLVPAALAQLGVERVLHKVNLKPGMPLWFGVLRRPAVQTSRDALAASDSNRSDSTASELPASTLVFGLPGNPVSGLVCFELFVRPAIARLAGRSDGMPRIRTARLAREFDHRGQRPTYHPARLDNTPDGLRIEPLAWRGSGDLAALVAANALAVFPGGDRRHAAGEIVEAIRL
jgi:molybdopterin molybdotransferase